jgi:hydroxymethylglutaryl-CoA lyase
MPELGAVKIVEVGPRDGLQNESHLVSTAAKLRMIKGLRGCGLKHIEATSFVHPNWIPQLADAADVAGGIEHDGDVAYSALVPNLKGLDRALESGFKHLAVFTAASDAFAQRNINMTVDESLSAFADVVAGARAAGAAVRGYVSTAFECPYAGRIDPTETVRVVDALLAMGIDEVAISDTIGVAAPVEVGALLARVAETAPIERIALHLHDTCGTALANVVAGLNAGVRTFDAAVGGLGGCPYAEGAAGNLATEDLVYLLDRMGFHTGVDLAAVVRVAWSIAGVLGREPHSRLARKVGASA